MSSFQEATTFPFDEEESEPQQPVSRSWNDSFMSRFNRSRSIGQQSDIEAPLLGGEEGRSHSQEGLSPSKGWPTLRLSSVSTRKLHVGSWGADEVGL